MSVPWVRREGTAIQDLLDGFEMDAIAAGEVEGTAMRDRIMGYHGAITRAFPAIEGEWLAALSVLRPPDRDAVLAAVKR